MDTLTRENIVSLDNGKLDKLTFISCTFQEVDFFRRRVVSQKAVDRCKATEAASLTTSAEAVLWEGGLMLSPLACEFAELEQDIFASKIYQDFPCPS